MGKLVDEYQYKIILSYPQTTMHVKSHIYLHFGCFGKSVLTIFRVVYIAVPLHIYTDKYELFSMCYLTDRDYCSWHDKRSHSLLDSLVVECWLLVREVPGSIPSQGPRYTKDVIKMVPVVPLFSTRH